MKHVKKIVILGMPGAGKGTMAAFLEQQFHWKHVSTGDILRKEIADETPLGKQVKEILSTGKLVGDALMGEIVGKTLEKYPDGFILDGYPRTLEQCKLLTETVDFSMAFYLKLDDDTAIARILERSKNSPDERADDTIEVIRNRLTLFHENNAGILNFFRAAGLLIDIDAAPPLEIVQKSILSHLA